MTANYALLWVKKTFKDKYTGEEYKSGEAAVFERKRALEIMAVLGEKVVREIKPPEGYALVPIDTPEAAGAEVAEEAAGEAGEEKVTGENAAAEKPGTRRGKNSKK